MPVLRNIGLLARCSPGGGQADIHLVPDAALVWEGDTIIWAGSEAELPSAGQPGLGTGGGLGTGVGLGTGGGLDAGGGLVVPGLVDCHTHLAFGGWRADEFSLRSRGATYQEIQAAGGGIRSSMRATRTATGEALFERSLAFLSRMARLGVTTVECKSGYGLNVADELKVLRVYRRLQTAQAVRIVPTFLGAHVVPPEYDHAGEYVDMLVDQLLPVIAEEGLAEFCDVFVEEGAFDADLARRLMAKAGVMGLRPKLHVDQLTDGGGAALAAEVGAISADHLEFASEEGIRAMARAGVVAVSLPIASLYLRQPPMPARSFIDAGCRVAVATDFNPGSAPSYHLPLAMTLACTMNGMTPAEALKGATIHAAEAIGRGTSVGSLDPGKKADFVILEAESVEHWLYHFVPNAAITTFVGGNKISQAA
jgi:imidazolonepropionase